MISRKHIAIASIIFISLLTFSFSKSRISKENEKADWKNGDIVFQDSESTQSEAIKLATNSKFSHCGIVFNLDNKWMVLEAVHPVRLLPIEDWIAQGSDGKYTKKRLKNVAILTDSIEDEMWSIGSTFLNKSYDIQFDWSDEKLYCSELVWKIYKRGVGLELGSPKMLKEYNLDSKLVKEQLKLRYGTDIPLKDKMISPQDIFESELLE